MGNYVVNDDFLYEHMPKVENIIIDNLPKEEDLSHRFSIRFKRKMKRLIKEEKRTPAFNSFINYSRRVAMIFLIVTSILFATAMSIEAYRERVFKKVIEILEEYTSIIFERDDDEIIEELEPLLPEYIPEGFEISEQQISTVWNYAVYSNQENKEIIYRQALGLDQAILDTVGVEIEYVKIGYNKAIIFTNKGFTQLYWDDGYYVYRIFSSIDRYEIIKMAESIIKK